MSYEDALLTPEAKKLIAEYRHKLRNLRDKASNGDKDAALKVIQTMTEEANSLRALGFRHNNKARLEGGRWEIIADMPKALIFIYSRNKKYTWRAFIQVRGTLAQRVIEVRPTIGNKHEMYHLDRMTAMIDAQETLKPFESLNTEWVETSRGMEEKIKLFIQKIHENSELS